MSFFNPSKLTTFERTKVKDIAELDKQKLNPLRTTIFSGGAGYKYSIADIRNYYEASHKSFALII